jgi:hypothetical protein
MRNKVAATAVKRPASEMGEEEGASPESVAGLQQIIGEKNDIIADQEEKLQEAEENQATLRSVRPIAFCGHLSGIAVC